MSAVLPVTANDRTETYVASAAQTVFAVPFPFLDAADLAVFRAPAAAPTVFAELLLGSGHWSATGAGAPSGGTVTLAAAAAAGDRIRIAGRTRIESAASITAAGKFASAALDKALDRGLLIAQEARRDIDALLAGTVSAATMILATGSLTARSLGDRFAEWFNVQDYGARGNGITLATVAISAAITAAIAAGGGCVFFPPGTYIVDDALADLRSNVHLLGRRGLSTIKVSADMADAAIIKNHTLGSFTDRSMGIYDLIFDGNNLGNGATQDKLVNLVEFVRPTDLHIEGCRFTNYGYIGLAVNGLKRGRVIFNEFDDLGYSGAAVTDNGGSVMWITSTEDVDWPTDVIVTGNHVHDCHWHGAHFSAGRGIFTGNTIENVREAGIFLARDGAVQNAKQLVITGNTIDGVRRKRISGHGIESGAHHALIADNIIRNVDHGFVSLYDVQYCSVRGNHFIDCNGYPDAGYSGVDIICSGAAVGAATVKGIDISGNRLTDTRTPQATRHAVRIQGGGAAPQNLVIRDNDFSGITFSTSMYDFAGLGANVVVRDNTGDYSNSRDEYVQLLAGDRVGSDVNTAQSIFAAGSDELTLQAGVTYEFELRLRIIRTAGTTSHFTSLKLGGTATINSVDYIMQATNPTNNPLAAVQQIWGPNANAITIAGPNTDPNENIHVEVKGTFRCTAPGSLIFQTEYTASPGGAPTYKRGCFARVRAIGSSGLVYSGPWS